MDFYSTKTPDSFRLIKALFSILMIVVVGIISLMFLLSLHESVHSEAGEIVSKNTPIDYLSPFEAEIRDVRVREGDLVGKGDTLIILYNEDLRSSYEKSLSELQHTRETIELLKVQLANRKNRVEVQKKEVGSIKTDLRFTKKGQTQEVASLELQVRAMADHLSLSKSALLRDKGLLRKGAISQMDYDKKFKSYLGEANQLAELKSQLAQKRLKSENFENNSSSQLSQQQLSILSSEADYLGTQKSLQQAEARLLQLEQKSGVKEKELARQYILADIDGYVSTLYNIKKEVNFIDKGKSLLLLRPLEEESFLARLPISEEAVKSIHNDLEARIQLKAYSHYKYGIIKGKIIHLDKDATNKFYVLVDIPAEYSKRFKLKSGYKVKGEIIIRKLKLYEYVFDKMFKKL